jgi:hypothetical protein
MMVVMTISTLEKIDRIRSNMPYPCTAAWDGLAVCEDRGRARGGPLGGSPLCIRHWAAKVESMAWAFPWLELVYFAASPSLGLVKIGTSGNVEGRLEQVRAGDCVLPEGVSEVPDVSLERVELGPAGHEKALHEQFAEYRTVGEWFTPGPSLVKRIAEDWGAVHGPYARPPHPGEHPMDRF